jgi:hypothetical protein
VIEDIGNLSLDLQWLMDERIFVLMLLIFTAIGWRTTKSSLGAIAAFLAGLLVWTLVLNREDLRDSIDEDITNPGSTVGEPSDGEGS